MDSIFDKPGFWIGLAAILIGMLTAAAIADDLKWEEFKSARHCKVVGKMRGDLVTGMGVTGDGKTAITVGSTPDKTGWLCDDGITYWR